MTAGIIGYGRFGKILASILKPGFGLKIFDPMADSIPHDFLCSSTEDVCANQLVFVAVPIRLFESVIKNCAPYIGPKTTVIDVCSVKVYPAKIMETLLPPHTGIICSHPMFGPDSYSPYRELKIVMHPLRDTHLQYEHLKSYFKNHSIRVVELTPEHHDRQAAASQGVTHFIGRVLEQAGVTSTEINTLGFTDLLSVIEQTCNDSIELFKDLQRYNPYTDGIINSLEKSIRQVHASFREIRGKNED